MRKIELEGVSSIIENKEHRFIQIRVDLALLWGIIDIVN